MNNNRGFDGRRDDDGPRDERELERNMQRERSMQGGMGRGWNEPGERYGYGGDDRYGGNMRRDMNDDRGGYDRDHDLRTHNFGFGGTDQGFRGGGYGGYGSDRDRMERERGMYGNPRGYERDRYGMGNREPYGMYGSERGRWDNDGRDRWGNDVRWSGPGRWGDERFNQDRGNSWGNDINRGRYGYERGSGVGGSHFGSDIGSGGGYGSSAGAPHRGYGYGYGHGVGMSDMGWEQRGYGEGMRRGKAPRSYQRSDERIKEDICDRLMHGWVDAENVDVRVTSGEVTLSGTVEDRQSKRAIEDIAEQVMGVREVQNQIRVQQEPQSHATSTAGTSSKKPTA